MERGSKKTRNESIAPVVSREAGEIIDARDQTTRRGLKSRHAQMIALGGTIGTGLFVSSGQGLQQSGPAFLLAAYIIITLLVYGVVTATTEFGSYLPVPGSGVAYYANRYASSSLGFALGWLYWYTFAIDVPNEITAAGLVIEYWNPPVPTAVWLTTMIVLVVTLNCLAVSYYGEAEFWFSSIKVVTIVGLLLLSIVLVSGGGPHHTALGFRYWKNPGAVKELYVDGASGRLCALLSSIVFSVFSIAFAPELMVVTGGEMEFPRRNLPKAGQRFFYRLLVFYVVGILFIGMIVSSDNKELLNGGEGAGSSPWVLAIKEAGIPVLDSIINAVIITSAWSCSNSFLYLSTRSLYSLALVGNAPEIFTRCSKTGVPYYALAASSSFSLLAYLNVSSKGSTVFNWLVNVNNCGGFISWICCCIVYIRFRKATVVQQITDIPYRSPIQPYASWVCLVAFTVLLLLNGYSVFVWGQWDTSTFVTAYVGIPVFLFLYFGHRYFVYRTQPWLYSPSDVDLKSGLDEVLAAEKLPCSAEHWYDKVRVLFD